MTIDYAGDDPHVNQMVSWFQIQLRAITTCLKADLPEAALALIYSGIDTFGLLAANPDIQYASRDTFKQWCDKYVLPRVQPVEGGAANASDLWGARCGVLHTSTPLSASERAGEARQIWYHLDGKVGVNLITITAMPALVIDIKNLALAFKEGGVACITEINQDAIAFQAASDRSQHFLRWGRYVA